MDFTATWYAGETAVSSENASNFVAIRDIAKCRLAAHRVRSGANPCRVRTRDGALMFDSREGRAPSSSPGLTLAQKLMRAINDAAR